MDDYVVQRAAPTLYHAVQCQVPSTLKKPAIVFNRVTGHTGNKEQRQAFIEELVQKIKEDEEADCKAHSYTLSRRLSFVTTMTTTSSIMAEGVEWCASLLAWCHLHQLSDRVVQLVQHALGQAHDIEVVLSEGVERRALVFLKRSSSSSSDNDNSPHLYVYLDFLEFNMTLSVKSLLLLSSSSGGVS
jgi:hypothetical protein